MPELTSVTVFNSPQDILSWPVTQTITSITMVPESGETQGLHFTFAPGTPDSWEVTPPGWTGSLRYTVWAVVNVNGTWTTSGFIQMWKDRQATGAPILTDFAKNWVYDDRWGTLAHYQPKVGELMGFFVSAGNARGEGGVTSVRERSNIVWVALPPGDRGTFIFAQQPTPAPAPSPAPSPAPDGPDMVATLLKIQSDLAALNLKLDALAVKPFPVYKGGLFGYVLELKPSA